MSEVYARISLSSIERNHMPTFEFSDDFDAQAWYAEQMSKGSNFVSHEDPYGWDEPAEYPY